MCVEEFTAPHCLTVCVATVVQADTTDIINQIPVQFNKLALAKGLEGALEIMMAVVVGSVAE